MDNILGLKMSVLLGITLILFAVPSLVIVALAWRSRLLLKLGLRNIPRRRAQTVLIIVGLMLSTTIITSAFGIGDTFYYSFHTSAVSNLGQVDETIARANTGTDPARSYFPGALTGRLAGLLAPSGNSDGVTGLIRVGAGVKDTTSGIGKARNVLLGLPTGSQGAFGALAARDGSTVTLEALGADGVYINGLEADDLNAHTGDRIALYVGSKATPYTVRAILRNQGLATNTNPNGFSLDPAVILPIGRLQQLVGQPGMINAVVISNRGDATSGAALSARVADPIRAYLASPASVAQAKAQLATAAGQAGLKKLADNLQYAGVKGKLTEVRAMVVQPGASDRLKALLSDPAVIDALRSIDVPASVGAPLASALFSISDYSVDTTKQSALDQADLFASALTLQFLLFGFFSVAAGVMLIFLIFVMLAAERRPEMGMERAIGTRRSQIIQQFLFEGYAYNLGAALVGITLGIVVSLGMVSVMSILLGRVISSGSFNLQRHIEPRSIAVAFFLGAVVTLITVIFSSWRASRVNVVAAIRDLPEDFGRDGSLREMFATLGKNLKTAPRRLRVRFGLSLVVLLLSVLLSKAVPLLAIVIVVFLALCWFWPLIVAFVGRGPIPLLLGLLLAGVGLSNSNATSYDLGISFELIGVAMLLRWLLAGLKVPDRLRNRICFTLAGLAVVVLWLIPADALNAKLAPDLITYFVAGLMLVLGGVWAVMFNADLILGALLIIFGRSGRLVPTLKMAISYPMQFKFRTGMTVAMFSLVIFILMFLSVFITSSLPSLDLSRDVGGYPIYATASGANPIDVAAQVRADPALSADVSGVGAVALVPAGIRQPGYQPVRYSEALLTQVDRGYLAHQTWRLHQRATGYGSDGAVWQALLAHPNYAILPGSLFQTVGDARKNTDTSATASFYVHKAYYDAGGFSPVRVQVRDARTGAVLNLTVIGILDLNAENLRLAGIFVGPGALAAAGDLPAAPSLYFFQPASGHDTHRAAQALSTSFLAAGLDVRETQSQFNDFKAINLGFSYLLEGFMGLGLVVGIAALGVIAFRSVVERRQQIGMLRAIGFQQSMVRGIFLLESSFVAILGTVLGLVLGALLGYQLVVFERKSDPSVVFQIPWAQVLIIVVFAYVTSLITTYLPARQASRIYPAEALRYE